VEFRVEGPAPIESENRKREVGYDEERQPKPARRLPMNNGRKPTRPDLSPSDVRFLNEIIDSDRWPDFTISRARTLLLLAQGVRVKDIAKQLGISLAAVGQRRRRFATTGILA
jgi:Homeodomain-like domain-containing protein